MKAYLLKNLGIVVCSLLLSMSCLRAQVAKDATPAVIKSTDLVMLVPTRQPAWSAWQNSNNKLGVAVEWSNVRTGIGVGTGPTVTAAVEIGSARTALHPKFLKAYELLSIKSVKYMTEKAASGGAFFVNSEGPLPYVFPLPDGNRYRIFVNENDHIVYVYIYSL